jgi:hypothetical protein
MLFFGQITTAELHIMIVQGFASAPINTGNKAFIRCFYASFNNLGGDTKRQPFVLIQGGTNKKEVKHETCQSVS